MRKINKRAFTLIELLAVIIILAVIALIATPIVLDVVESAKKSAFESTAYGMIDAMKLKSAEDMIDGNSMTKEYTFPNSQLDVQGSQPNGLGSVDSQGRISIAVYNGDWCATKGFTDGTITVKEYVEGECILPTGDEPDDDVVVITGDPIREKIAALVLDENGDCKTDDTTYEYMGGCYIKAEPSTALANHVWYNGFLWRIMGINNLGTENESIKMITEENVTAIPYNVADNTNFDGSHADSWLNDYFYNKLSNENNLKTDIIVEGVFCQGAATTTSPSNNICTGTTFSRNVGLISVDEMNLAGGGSSYLRNLQVFWTMSPYDSSNVWKLDVHCGTYKSGTTQSSGLRPVINVKSNSIITGGNGTLSDFYVLGEYKNETSTIEKLNNAKIGEYVSLNNKIYRVVENGTTTKLILDGYYQENGTNYTMKYGSDNVFTIENRNTEDETLSGIGYKLNTAVLNWLTDGDNQEKLKDMIVTGNWYQSEMAYYANYNSYTASLDETGIPIEAQVGLIRVGEMLSGQSYSILTNNGKMYSSYGNAKNYWTMTPFPSGSATWDIDSTGYSDYDSSTDLYSLRPVINVNSNLTISSGNGTLGSPFVIEVK